VLDEMLLLNAMPVIDGDVANAYRPLMELAR
jgi:hypothetical protein